MPSIERVLVLGCGYAGSAVARLARKHDLETYANVRSDAKASALRAEGLTVLQQDAADPGLEPHLDAHTHVVIAFGPDGSTDARLAPRLAAAGAITYLSSTGVYGEHRGLTDDATPIPASPPPGERAARILAAEALYLRQGATVLRCPALYGPARGLHLRVLRGEHRIPGDGTRYLSRIHVEDLAQLVLAAGRARVSALVSPGQTFVVGDREPAPHGDVVRFIAEAYGVAMPPFVPLESVHESLRADRRVDATRALTTFGITLRYPSYRDGMTPAATGIDARAPAMLARP